MYFYAIGVLFDMIYGYFVAIFVLNKYIRPSFSSLERKGYQREIQSLYFNFALMYPIFKECLLLKQQSFSQLQLENCIVLSAYLLVGDILLDEKVEHERNSSFVVLLGKLEEKTKNFVDEKLQKMIRGLQQVQARENEAEPMQVLEEKGLWLPALLYPLGKSWKEQELQRFQLVGALLKLADDYADRENDKKNGVITLCSNATASKAQSIYDKYQEKVKNSLLQFSRNPSACIKFWRNISWQTNAFVAFENEIAKKSIEQQKVIRKSLFQQLRIMIHASFALKKE